MTNGRHTDWSPLTGGDPCPGDPLAWDSMSSFWFGLNDGISAYAEVLSKHTTIDADGKTFGRLEATFTDGRIMVNQIAYEFEKASSTVRSWRNKLSGMQTRADEALQKAKNAQGYIVDAQGKIAALEQEAARDDSPDPIISLQIRGLMGDGGLVGEIAGYEAEIAAAQKVVDEIREEYSRESASIIEAYSIAVSVSKIYDFRTNKGMGGNPFSSADAVRGSLWKFDDAVVSAAFDKARRDPGTFPELLVVLGEMTPEEMHSYFSTHQEDALFAVNPVEGDVTARALLVQEWWNAELVFDETGRYLSSRDRQGVARGRLSEEQRQALVLYAPGFVGNMPGVCGEYAGSCLFAPVYG